MLAKKLWRVSQILDCSPFDQKLLAHTDAQLDFILINYSRDNPKELRYVRAQDMELELAEQKTNTGWANVLIGKAADAFKAMKSFPIPERFRANGVVTRRPPAPAPRPTPQRPAPPRT